MLHEALAALRSIADDDVPREAAQQLINGLNDVIGKVRAHDPSGSVQELGDAIAAFDAAIRSTEEAMVVMAVGAEHISTAANG